VGRGGHRNHFRRVSSSENRKGGLDQRKEMGKRRIVDSAFTFMWHRSPVKRVGKASEGAAKLYRSRGGEVGGGKGENLGAEGGRRKKFITKITKATLTPN